LVETAELRGESSMHAKDFLINKSGNRETVEAVGERFPQFDVISALAFVVEAINTVNGGTLVVSSEQEEVLGVLDLVGEQQADGLETLLATVHVVTKEEVVGVGRESTILKKSQQVVVLTMYITADLDWRLQLQQNGLTDKDVSRSEAETSYFLLGEVHLLAWSTPSDF